MGASKPNTRTPINNIYIPIPKHVAESVKRTKKPSAAEPKRQKQNRLFRLKMNQKFTKKCANIIIMNTIENNVFFRSE